MAISIDWETYVISIPQSYLTLQSGTLYTMDTDQFRLDLKALEASIYGMGHPKTHNHNTEVTIAGITYSRSLELLAPYSITFEDGQYSVVLQGSNNNFFDIGNGILNQNQVQVIPTNSAGLITKSIGSGLSQEEHDKLMILPDESDITAAVWADNQDAIILLKLIRNRREIKKDQGVWHLVVYDDDNVTPILSKVLKNKDGDNISDLKAGVIAMEMESSA